MKIISRKTGIIFILIGLCAPIVTLLLSDYGYHHNIFLTKITLVDKRVPLYTKEEIEKKIKEDKEETERISKEIAEEEKLGKPRKGRLVSISVKDIGYYSKLTERFLIEISYRYILAFCIILVFVGIGILVYTPMGIMRNRNE